MFHIKVQKMMEEACSIETELIFHSIAEAETMITEEYFKRDYQIVEHIVLN